MAANKVVFGTTTIIDITDTTLTPDKALDGYDFYDAAGVKQTGTTSIRSASDVTVSGATVTVPSGAYASQVQKSVATGSAGTPTATKGTVSNHAVSVTPSVTNTTGYITGGTKTGTAVTVSASELVSGTKSISENGTGIDVTNFATIDVSVPTGGDVVQDEDGYVVLDDDGQGLGVVPFTASRNGTYNAPSGFAYNPVTVNVPSSWTKIAEANYQVSTTGTSSTTIATLATGHSELWTSDKWVYVRVRDTEGKRDGYFYGSDQFFYNIIPVNHTTTTNTTTALRIYIRYSGGNYAASPATGSTGYGVYADCIYSNGDIRIRSRYSSSSSLTIDSTYKVEAYILNPSDSIPIFE